MRYSLGDKSLLFKYISINLKNVYLSTIHVSDEYTLDLAKHIYNYLHIYYPKLTIKDNKNNIIFGVEDISQYFLFGHNKDSLSNTDIGARIKPKIAEIKSNESNDKTNIIYDDNSETIPESISDINKYNIIDWPINDSVIQFLQPGVVISEYSTVDEIASAQYSLLNAGYKIPKIENTQIDNIGAIDEKFNMYCYAIQKSEMEKDANVVATGYYDIYVESYTRGLSEVRS